jgi:murein L,D-transpeptidase YcbB/YkuD
MTPPADRHDVVALLGSALANASVFETSADLAPQFRQYAQLRQALARYRALAAEDTPDSVRLEVPVHPGDTVAGLAGLVRRLEANGDLAEAPRDTAVYGPEVVAALRRFQERHGLEPDGVIGRETVAELNVRLDWRVHQLDLALERLRWLPDLSEGRFLLVNIPMFELYAYDSIGPGSTPSLRMDVIVGKALSTETPIFAEEMRYLIFQPYWNVPPSILRGEILPGLRKDSTYLRKNDMEIVQGPGDDAAPLAQSPANLARLGAMQLRVRQRPGPRNSLGPLKFMFPNDENIYLHGTPAQELFGRTRRDFSHGCVRVEDPAVLAAYVLRDLPEWNLERIREAMTTGPRSRRVNLPRTLPVLLFYTTASVMPDGTIRFARDIYGHDQRLDAALHAVTGAR